MPSQESGPQQQPPAEGLPLRIPPELRALLEQLNQQPPSSSESGQQPPTRRETDTAHSSEPTSPTEQPITQLVNVVESQPKPITLGHVDHAKVKVQISEAADHAVAVGKQAENNHPEKRNPFDLYGRVTGRAYDAAAKNILYNPNLLLNGMLSRLNADDSRTRTATNLVVRDQLRAVFEQYFPQFQGKLSKPMKILGGVVKFAAPLLQIGSALDTAGDWIMTAGDIAEGKPLTRLAVDGGLMLYDLIPLSPGDIALFDHGLDSAERITEYGLMEALITAMSDPDSPLYSHREEIAHSVLEAKSLVASTANVALLNGEKSILGKARFIETDAQGDLYVKLWKLRLPIMKREKTPQATRPYAEQIPDPQHAFDTLNAKKQKQGIEGLSRQEQMQWKMLLLILQAQEILKRQPKIVDATTPPALPQPQE